MFAKNLTELELAALSPDVVNLSDGHARQSLAGSTRDRIREVMDTMMGGRPVDYFEAERRFLNDLSWHTGQEYPDGRTFVTYASSVAMGMVATHLRRLGRPVGIMCPTFDNIPGILRTMDVEPVAIPERNLAPSTDLDRLKASGVGALVLVVPNNPTGCRPTREIVHALMEWAADNDVLLVLDVAFRWFDDATKWDLIRAADERGADVISIDDTGKALSFSDLKAAIIGTSRRLAAPMQAIHTQYVLNVSEMVLRILSTLMDPGRVDNEIANARRTVAANRAYLDAGLAASLAVVGHDPRMPSRNDGLSVEWLALPGCRDRVVGACRDRGVEVLTGDHFYWSPDTAGRGRYVRLALMRDPAYFARGADVFVEALAAESRPTRTLARVR